MSDNFDEIKDIYMEENNIYFVNGDFIEVKGNDLLKQNIIRRLTTPRGSIFFDKNFGSEIYKWLKRRDVSTHYAELHIKEVLIECEEINPSTIEVKVVKSGEALLIRTSFEMWKSRLTEKLNIALRDGEVRAGFVS